MGHAWEFNTFKQANVCKFTDYPPPDFQVRTAPDLSPEADLFRSRGETNCLFLFLVPIASIMRAKNSEKKSRRSLSILGFDSVKSANID